jgi:NAD(P)-dependent dehydrogenase (short-subunit alcohol dehydrogenase family)
MRITKDTIALITGAGSGIGRETALALARKGARLIICDVNPSALASVEQEINALSQCLLAETVDVSDRNAMRAFSEKVHKQVGGLDILINNAGIGVAGTLMDTPLDEWDRVLNINLKGVLHGCHFFVPAMLAHGRVAHIVNLSSLAGFWPAPGLNAYSTAKFGVFGLSECLRLELAKTPIGVSVICPGIIHTNIVRNTAIHGKENVDVLRDKIEAQYKKRGYTPDRVAAAIVKAIERNRAIVPVAPESWIMYCINRINLPLSRKIALLMTKEMDKK